MQAAYDSVDELIGDIQDSFRQVDLTDELREIAALLRMATADNFTGQHGPDGERWPQWFFRRPEADDNHLTLIDTGRLYDSTQAGPDHIENYTATSLEFGTSVPYAATHQLGANMTTGRTLVARGGGFSIPAGSRIHIPARRFMGISNQLADQLAESVADFMVDRLFGTP